MRRVGGDGRSSRRSERVRAQRGEGAGAPDGGALLKSEAICRWWSCSVRSSHDGSVLAAWSAPGRASAAAAPIAARPLLGLLSSQGLACASEGGLTSGTAAAASLWPCGNELRVRAWARCSAVSRTQARLRGQRERRCRHAHAADEPWLLSSRSAEAEVRRRAEDRGAEGRQRGLPVSVGLV